MLARFGRKGARPTHLTYTRPMRTRLACFLLATSFVAIGASSAVAQDADILYRCTAADETRALDIGVTVCDAAPTDGLTERMEVDNLQLRSGALITEVTPGGLGQTAGLASGDVIYRVGGVDVADTVLAAARLSLIESDTDTVVNFLRRGRPYRVKLRQE